MVLNWTPEVIVEIFTSVIILIATLLMYITPRTKNIKSLSYIRLGLFFMGMLFALDLLANLFLLTLLCRISGLMLFPSAVFFAIGINYTIKETSNSPFLIIVIGLGVLYCYLAFQPGAIGFEYEGGHLNVNWIGLYELVGSIFIFFVGSASFYWGLKTWLNAPFLIKREALIFFLGTVINGPLTLIIYLFYYWNPIFILFAYATTGLGILILCLGILKEPKLLYILPFTVNRLVVRDREGNPLFDHDWSRSSLSESIFTGFLNTVQLMSEEVINKGGLLDINLEEGIFTLYESELISVGLVASKYSKLLRECVVQFTRDFEQKFERELKKQVKDIAQYEGAFELIEKYFSNFPYSIIKSKKQPLLLAGKFAKIALDIENKLNVIFTNEKEYQAIKTELLKSPVGLSSEFFTLYNDLIDEKKRISEEKSLFLNDNNDLDK
ncbi:MAG: hypothetical protein KAT66_05395 [Candidatus Lokiarchaeota archaeon]|nr:hypothetical protein [Candidatus Lokiarchaeota archaeon]